MKLHKVEVRSGGVKSEETGPTTRRTPDSSLLTPLSARGVTLVEVVISMAIAAITISSIVAGYVFSARQLEQAACSSAAEFMARQRVEQVRSAKWDPLAEPPVNELVSSNFPVVVAALDIPVAANNPLNATNTTTITTVSTNPPLKMIRVDCVWWLLSRGPFTNTLTAYRAPDQ